MGQAGDLSLSGLWNWSSPRVYSLVARNQGLSAIQNALLTSAGYPDSPGVADGLLRRPRLAGIRVVWRRQRVGQLQRAGLQPLRPWVKLDLFNMFNNQKLIAWNTTVSQNRAAGVDNLGLATFLHPRRHLWHGHGQHGGQ